ncbi:TetR/AcrR family transcriptional regulator [Saccharopolyspora sp. HNM0983]|uniref:TetR/AcrR family transcriptional regulator n=1 Tax=Saccharopolyspora montiporae TaxID=2781240 RepID=A0A929FWP7_9PSEU|nr:TetR/AcrR family transcriptional regulator [Saccharopolyspora sp. HNM0983]MBE9373776.1 TetR/AcrR family transcriptional regulator [Saccharopolyspora sp. HNM0983]
MSSTSSRVYGGLSGEQRRSERHALLVEAGLNLLGAEEDPKLTVRGACSEAGLVTRYFYESFADRDELVIAVFDRVVSEVAAAALRAIEDVPDLHDRARAGLGAIVGSIAEDPRRGRLLFSSALNSPVLVTRRARSTRMFVQLLREQARSTYGTQEDPRADLLADFLVGGLAQVLSAWLSGTLDTSQEEIVERCAALFLAAGDML